MGYCHIRNHEHRDRFIEEMKILKSLSHPNVLEYIGIFCESRRLFLVTEYIDGRNLDRLAQDRSQSLSWGMRFVWFVVVIKKTFSIEKLYLYYFLFLSFVNNPFSAASLTWSTFSDFSFVTISYISNPFVWIDIVVHKLEFYFFTSFDDTVPNVKGGFYLSKKKKSCLKPSYFFFFPHLLRYYSHCRWCCLPRTQMALHLATGMEYVHSRNILHRDLKSANCMVRSTNLSVVIVDFGLARVMKGTQLLITFLTIPLNLKQISW